MQLFWVPSAENVIAQQDIGGVTMADELERSKGIASVVHAFLSFVPTELREMLGFFTEFVLMGALPVSLDFQG